MAKRKSFRLFEDRPPIGAEALDTDTLLVALHAVNDLARVSASDGGPQTEEEMGDLEETSKRLAMELGRRLKAMRFGPMEFPMAEWGVVTLYIALR